MVSSKLARLLKSGCYVNRARRQYLAGPKGRCSHRAQLNDALIAKVDFESSYLEAIYVPSQSDVAVPSVECLTLHVHFEESPLSLLSPSKMVSVVLTTLTILEGNSGAHREFGRPSWKNSFVLLSTYRSA